MVTKKQENQKSQFDLRNIEAICGHMGGIQHHTAIDWRNYHKFPIHRINAVWMAYKKELDDWCQQRGITDPQKVTRLDPEKHELRQLEKAGKVKKIGRKLKGINEITSFYGQSVGTVYNWWKDWKDFPAKKDNNELVAQADELLAWLI